MHTFTRHPMQGVGLIEVMISLVILGVGLLGIAQLQIASVKLNHNAYLYSQGTALAYDAFDRMRSNPETANAAASLGPRWPSGIRTDNWTTGLFTTQASACIDASSGTAACNSATMAQADLNDWANKVYTRLPNGTAQIVRSGTNTYTVNIWWQERRTGTAVASTTEQLSITGEL